MMYDLAIIGAGPAGLMAAKTAAAQGGNVILLEKFNTVSAVSRACCQQFVMDENYENENIRVETGKIVFPDNGFSVDYDGPLHNITDTWFISPKGHAVHFSYPDKHAIAVKFDKGYLLQSMLDDCIAAGVEYRNSTLAYSTKDLGNHVELHIMHNGSSSKVQARKLIAADGVNSRTVESLGFNKDRMHFATALCIIYSLEGVEGFEPTAMKWHMGLAYGSYAPVIIDPSLEGRHIADLVVMGSAQQKPEDIFKAFTTTGPLADRYKSATIRKRTGCTVKAYNSLMVPHRGNVLVIGDAAAYVEVEVQGALMCGYHGAYAVCKELNGENGFDDYTGWWQRSFEFNSEEALRVAQGYALVPTYTDDEIDYLFALVEDRVLDGAYGQYKAPKLLWDAILEHREKIAAEKPELYAKFSSNQGMTLGETFQKD